MLRHLSALLVLAFLGACTGSEARPGEDAAATAQEGPAPSVPSEAAGVDQRPVVVFLGTSLTAGLGLLDDDDTYVARVAELADSAGLPIRVVNAGVSGDTSAGGLRRVDWTLREPFDVHVLELGANDGLRGQDPGALADNLTEIIRRTRARYPDVRVVIVGMEAPPNLGIAYTGAFHAVFPTVAEQEDAALVPFLLEGVGGVPELNQNDGIHPTPEGHRRVALNVWTVLEPILAGLRAERS